MDYNDNEEIILGACPECDNGFMIIVDSFAGIVSIACTNPNCDYEDTKQGEALDVD